MAKGKADYELDYVYLKNSDMMFDSVHVVLSIAEEGITMTLQSETEIAEADVAEVLDGLQTGTLKKMQLEYGVNCFVFLVIKGKNHTVSVSKGNTTVITLTPAE